MARTYHKFKYDKHLSVIHRDIKGFAKKPTGQDANRYNQDDIQFSLQKNDVFVAFAGDPNHKIDSSSRGVAGFVWRFAKKQSKGEALTTAYKGAGQDTNPVTLKVNNLPPLIAFGVRDCSGWRDKPKAEDWQDAYRQLYTAFRAPIIAHRDAPADQKTNALKGIDVVLPGIGAFGYNGPAMAYLARYALMMAINNTEITSENKGFVENSYKATIRVFKPSDYWQNVTFATVAALFTAAAGTGIAFNLLNTVSWAGSSLFLGGAIAVATLGLIVTALFSNKAHKPHFKPFQHKAMLAVLEDNGRAELNKESIAAQNFLMKALGITDANQFHHPFREIETKVQTAETQTAAGVAAPAAGAGAVANGKAHPQQPAVGRRITAADSADAEPRGLTGSTKQASAFDRG